MARSVLGELMVELQLKNLLEVVRGRVSVEKDEAEVFRLLLGAAAEEMGSGNRDSICVVGFIEEMRRARGLPEW
ncbi:hypothetical protein TNCV_2254081 [Trichonephila clavipes]|nr:hypothetical protein TNCV_2254081 [Trichonephila clavipes]